ncbi:MAG: sigma-70 family RNA polymerase sigma factor [Ignavibacteria bacterium]|nr:sigma-70 family RNA polymerase sigma factor [Ignavibacteria bacterium]
MEQKDELTKDKLWLEFSRNPSKELRNKLVLRYISLVKTVLRTIKIPQTSILTKQDLINFGIIGLIEAIERFDLRKEVKFETFAYQRIRGSMLDEIRRVDWLSRSARQKAQEVLNSAEQKSSSDNLDFPKSIDKAQLNEKELAQFALALQSSQEAFFIGEVSPTENENNDINFLENLPYPDDKSPLEKMVDNEKIQLIVDILKSLPERDRLIITLHYYENLKFREISAFLGISESRISQIHSAVIKRIREKFRKLEE